MKICIVSLHYVPFLRGDTTRTFGGAEVQTAFLVDALQEHGHEVTMVVADYDGGPFPCAVENAFHSARGIPGLRFFMPRAYGILRALARADADVYYQRNAGMITGLVAWHCRRTGHIFVYGAGSDVDFSRREMAVNNPRDRWLFRSGLRRADGVVVQNAVQRDAAVGAVRGVVEVIPNGVRVGSASRGTGDGRDSPDADAGGGGYVAWVGAMWQIKRPDLVLELATRLPGVSFVVVGGDIASEPGIGHAVRRAARALENVRLTGRLPREAVYRVLRGALCLVNTSDAEGFPNAYLEAWSEGVPVVTLRDVDGLVDDSGAGVVCASIEEMIATLGELATDPARARAMGRVGREMVRARFSPGALAARYTAFFERVLAAHGGSGARATPPGDRTVAHRPRGPGRIGD